MESLLQTDLLRSEEPSPGIAGVLRELDARLAEALRIAALDATGGTLADPFRGLYITQQEAEKSLQQEPGAPRYAGASCLLDIAFADSPLKELQNVFSLGSFDAAAVAIALAPEIDLRYERVYSFLQNDVTRKRPSVDLVLNLLCSSAEERLMRRRHFAPNAPLLRHGILTLLADSNSSCPPLLAHAMKLDEGVVQFLLGEAEMDPRVAPFCRLTNAVPPAKSEPSGEMTRAFVSLTERTPETGHPAILLLRGKSRLEMRETAEGAAAEQRRRLLIADLPACAETGAALQQRVQIVLREARLRGAIAYLDGIDGIDEVWLAQTMAELGDSLIVASTKPVTTFPYTFCRAITIEFPSLTVAQRKARWRDRLSDLAIAIDDNTLDALAARFRLTIEQIDQAIAEGAKGISGCIPLLTADAGIMAIPDALFEAARGQSGRQLASVAREVRAKQTWDDLVLPQQTITQLQEFCGRIVSGEQVLSAWGFEQKLSYGKGASALFAGPSGTGKTMAAETIALATQLALYRIDLASEESGSDLRCGGCERDSLLRRSRRAVRQTLGSTRLPRPVRQS
jgi:hypothetical protein